CAAMWQAMGAPSAVTLVELGPGRGTLMRDLLRGTAHIPGFHTALSVHLVEASPVLAEKQRRLLADAHPPLFWHGQFSEVPGEQPFLVVANEFFDALPIRQYA